MTLQVVARRKDSKPGEVPSFTKTVSFEEMFEQLSQNLPVDIVYAIVPDERGYSLQEVGVLALHFMPLDLQSLPVPQPYSGLASHNASSATQAEGASTTPATRQAEEQGEPARALPEPKAKVVVTPAQTTFQFEPIVPTPKSQAELLAERGIDEKAQQKAAIKQHKRKREAKQAAGKVKVTGFIPATEAESRAASKFGKVN